jgi:rhodanese-related sulfurtransferase
VRSLLLLLVVVPLVACSRPAPPASSVEATSPPAAKGAPEATPEPPKTGSYRDASIGDLEEVLATAHLLDVRSSAEFEGGHVPGARLLPNSELPTRLAELEEWRSEEIWLICQSGGRSGRAGQLLKAEGFNVVNVRGGTGAWIASGRPIE